MVQFVMSHIGEISTVLLLILSEAMALNPKLKSNGIVDLIVKALSSKAAPIAPPQA